MIYKRDLSSPLGRYASKFPVLAVLGPRQSGKSTLVRSFFERHSYFNLEDPSVRERIGEDPKLFLRQTQGSPGIIIDEFQHLPSLLSYIQIAADAEQRMGYFVLTGSQNFLMNQAISQSLAGRVGILNLLPLSIHELSHNTLLRSIDELLFSGTYPALFARDIGPRDYYPSYLQTYVERDVRQIANVGNLHLFQRFMALCAARVGQLINVSEIAGQCGIAQKTAQSWLGILEASYVVFVFRPHFTNFNKRLTKTPKLYFHDTGLAAALLGLRSARDLSASAFRGHLFENFMIADFYKQFFNMGLVPPLYFWRDQNGRLEIDVLVDQGIELVPIEIKSAETLASDFFAGLKAWNQLSQSDPSRNILVYGGDGEEVRSLGRVYGWQVAGTLMERL